jgi:1,2-diacylglycerol 3-alpha-glucosyltransferase
MMTLGKMNIGMFVETHQPGVGLFHVMDAIARHLSESLNVYIFTTQLKDQKTVDDYPYQVVRHVSFKIPFLNIALPLGFLDFKFHRLLKEANLDIIHIHSGHTMGNIGVQYAKKHQIPIIGTIYGLVNLDQWNPATEKLHTEKDIEEIKHAYHQCQLVFSSHKFTDTVLELDELMKKPVILPLGTDIISVEEQTSNQLRQKHGIKADEKVLLSLNHHVSSHIEFISDALFKLRLKGYKFKWIILDQQENSESLKNHLKKNGLLPHAIIIQKETFIEAYQSYFKLADLICHASLLDPLYTILVDAASQRKCVLSVENSLVSRLITDGSNGYLSQQTPTAYAEKIIEILKYPKVVLKVGDKAHQDFYRTWHDLTPLMIEAYNQAKEHAKQTL